MTTTSGKNYWKCNILLKKLGKTLGNVYVQLGSWIGTILFLFCSFSLKFLFLSNKSASKKVLKTSGIYFLKISGHPQKLHVRKSEFFKVNTFTLFTIFKIKKLRVFGVKVVRLKISKNLVFVWSVPSSVEKHTVF